MKKIEIILGVTVIASILSVLLAFTMANQMIISSIGMLSLFYMYFGVLLFCNIPFRKAFNRSSYESMGTYKVIGAILVGLSLSASLIGLLFKLMIWPNANIELFIGLSGLLIATGVSLYKYKLNSSDFYLGVIKRMLIYIPIVLLGLLMPKYAMLELQYKDYPSYIEAFIKQNENPTDPMLIKKLEEERSKLLEDSPSDLE